MIEHMAQMLVRGLDDEVRDRLRERAKAHGRSVEAEVREILRTAVMSEAANDERGLGTRIAELFSEHGFDLDEAMEGKGYDQTVRPASFDE